jgi:hypothetical protein
MTRLSMLNVCSYRKGIAKKRKQKILEAIVRHNQFRELTARLADPYNIVIGLVYLVTPYLMVICAKVVSDAKFNLSFRVIISVVMVITVICTYLVNYVSASITIRNNKVAKHLYPLFFARDYTDLRLKLNIEEFFD